MKITFVGASSYIPHVGEEAASFLVDGRILIDTGWCNLYKLREYGLDPLALEALVITHFHQDHYIGLPQLLFYLGLAKHHGSYRPRRPFSIVGPSRYLEAVVNTALAFLQLERFPEIALELNLVPLAPGETYQDDTLRFDTMAGKHFSGGIGPEESLVYRVTERNTGKRCVFSGDTSFHPPIAEFAAHVPVLVHDAVHTLPQEAATIARMADAQALYLVHCAWEMREQALAEARQVFARTFLATEGETLEI